MFHKLLKAGVTVAAVASAAWLLEGCPDDQVSHTHIVREPAAAAPAPAAAPMAAPMAPAAAPAGGGMPAMAGDVPVPPRPEGRDGLAWALPSGWQEERPGGIRYATLKPNVAGNLEASVVVLPGPAGGELANVNRWRGQLGLSPVEDSALPSLRKNVESKAGTVALYDFASDGSQKTRLVAGLLSYGDSSWFFKLMGEDRAVAAATPGFTHLLQSLHPASAK